MPLDYLHNHPQFPQLIAIVAAESKIDPFLVEKDYWIMHCLYLEQLTYLIFLKMADEYSKPPYNRDVGIPTAHSWQSLKSKKGAELEVHYVTLLRELGNKGGMLGQIFTKAQNKIQDPAKLYRLIDMVDSTEWVTIHTTIAHFP